ncbi:MAG: hypothetical protein V3W04_09620 [Gammaproteobacteria bacterium]
MATDKRHPSLTRRLGKNLGKGLVFMVALVALMALLMFFVFPNQQGIADARQSLDSISVWLSGLRLGLIALLWWFWDTLFGWYFNDQESASQVEALATIKTQRHTLCGLLLAIEIILVQNVFATVWGWIQ